MFSNTTLKINMPEQDHGTIYKKLTDLETFISKNKQLKKCPKVASELSNFIKQLKLKIEDAPYIINSIPIFIAITHTRHNHSDIAIGSVTPAEAIKRAHGKDALSFVCSRLSDIAYSFGADPNSSKAILPLIAGGIPAIHSSVIFENYNSFKDASRHGGSMEAVSENNYYPINFIFSKYGEVPAEQTHKDIYAIYRNESLKLIRNYVIENTKDVNVQSSALRTALHDALETPSTDNNIAHLIKKGANVNLADYKGNSPLHIAATNNRISALKIIATKNPNLNLQNKEGKTPLHLSSLSNNLEFMKELVKLGADITIKDNLGKTAAEYLSPEKRQDWRALRNSMETLSNNTFTSSKTNNDISFAYSR